MRKENNKGITLIALIITIIVMLILVAVTVTVALNGGLFTTAKDAADETKVEGEKERLLSITLGTLNKQGKVDYGELETALEGTEFELNGDIITNRETQKTYKVSDRGSVTEESAGGETPPPTGGNGGGTTLTWTLTESTAEDNVAGVSVGDIVTASNGESFYVIKTPEANETTVKLLAAKCVNTSTWIQDDSYNTVAFDAITNEYANASIKGLVETYVTGTLGLNANQGMLMSNAEAIALQTGHTDILYGTSPKWEFWIDSPSVVNTMTCGGAVVGADPIFGERRAIS